MHAYYLNLCGLKNFEIMYVLTGLKSWSGGGNPSFPQRYPPSSTFFKLWNYGSLKVSYSPGFETYVIMRKAEGKLLQAEGKSV